jgi:GT2 family glycosyltransferase
MAGPETRSDLVVSVIVLNYNGAKWIRPCIESIIRQKNRAQIELIVADNLSTDGSAEIAEQMLRSEPGARFIQHGTNLGFCEGNNQAARVATGKYLFFMNNDAWMEPDCLELLIQEVEKHGAAAATPYVMNWADDNFQWVYVHGYDLFGLPSFKIPPEETREMFMPPGCSYLIRRTLFERIGEFDPSFFMYADELDLSWRVWIAGESAVVVPKARLHHRGAADVNPHGGERIVTYQTSESKRYYTNRNCIITLLKNCENILLVLVPLQILLLLFESVVALILIRRWSFVRKSYFGAIRDALDAWESIAQARQSVASFRKRGDLRMLRFLCWRLNRWDEFMQTVRMGVPKVAGR